MALKLRPGQFFGRVVEKAEIGNFILSETVYPRGLTVPRHSHENAYYCIVLRGSYDQTYGCRNRVCQPLTLEYHPSGESHSARFSETVVRSFNIELRSSWMAMLADFPVSLEESSAYQGGPPAWLALRLHQEYRQRDALTPLALESLALELVVQTSRRYVAPDRHRLPVWLARAKELLEASFCDSVTLSGVAAQVGVHPVHLAPQTPEAKLTRGHKAPLQTSAISTRGHDPHYNLAASLHPHLACSCSFPMSRGAPARSVNSAV
jgi:hypothetical protein